MGNPFARKRAIKKQRFAGDIRQNQLITSFGVGSIVDFVRDTVTIAGVDDWDENNEELHLYNENLQSLTGAKYFIKPKTEDGNKIYNKSKDIPSYVFPEKLYCPNCKKIYDVKELQNQSNPHKCFACGNPQLVAARFVVVCENGHIEDFPYSWWVHKGNVCEKGKENHRVEMFNVDGRSGIDSLMVKCCDCEKIRPMQNAFQENALAGLNGFHCKGYFSHLKNPMHFSGNGCTAILKTRLRTSSSVYFPVIQSALSIPPWSRETVKAIIAKFDDIKWIPSNSIEAYLLERILPTLPKQVTLNDLIKALELVTTQKQVGTIRKEKDIYQDEYIALSKGDSEDGEFSSFTVKTQAKYKRYIDKIVVVDRLTETQALCGFTRIKPWDGRTLKDEKIAPLSMYKKDWLPAVKMNGEGIFIKFNQNQLDIWETRIENRYKQLAINYEESYLHNSRFSSKYIALHTFSHLLMRQISNECGYSVASLKEKIYSTFYDEESNNLDMQGVLIYLATADCDGSLGGLISIAQDEHRLQKILDDMLEKALWCSADPLCINSIEQGFSSLNYAACHDCTLLPETSCEFRNVLLDRVSIVGTVENRNLGVFGEIV
ncbi:MAG: DrmB family protein [Clostridium sp.]|uniref:DrmB family protein n=1 Tax=Clostridium sp. TaxID=1506 RepID=UPI003D6DA31B